LVPNKAAITIKESTFVETDCRAEQCAKVKNILGTKMVVGKKVDRVKKNKM